MRSVELAVSQSAFEKATAKSFSEVDQPSTTCKCNSKFYKPVDCHITMTALGNVKEMQNTKLNSAVRFQQSRLH